MTWFSVGVEARRPDEDPRDVDLDEELLDAFMDAVAAYDGVVGGDRGTWDARISVEATDAAQASAVGTELVRACALKAGLPDWPLVRVEATRHDVLDEELARPNYPDIVGAPEAAEILHVARQRVHQLLRDRPDFPRPLYRPKGVGPLWIRAGIEAFGQRWERKPGRPPKRAATSQRAAARTPVAGTWSMVAPKSGSYDRSVGKSAEKPSRDKA